jgi:membrane associated rhomboid family serine protease
MNKIKLLSIFMPAILLTVVIWITFLADNYFELHLWRYGLFPRTLRGLTGIFTMPFIHGDTGHIVNNSIPLIILTTLLFHFYKMFFFRIMSLVWLSSGLWTWVFARPSFHIGASALIYGLAAFIFFAGVMLKEKKHAAISFLTVFLYGSIVWGIFPIDVAQSWEGHLTGFLAGTMLAFFYRKDLKSIYLPPEPEEDEEGDDDDDTDQYWQNTTMIN